jgi:hypothetical protein
LPCQIALRWIGQQGRKADRPPGRPQVLARSAKRTEDDRAEARSQNKKVDKVDRVSSAASAFFVK